jgi:hypothetical protein
MLLLFQSRSPPMMRPVFTHVWCVNRGEVFPPQKGNTDCEFLRAKRIYIMSQGRWFIFCISRKPSRERTPRRGRSPPLSYLWHGCPQQNNMSFQNGHKLADWANANGVESHDGWQWVPHEWQVFILNGGFEHCPRGPRLDAFDIATANGVVSQS